MEGTSWKPGKFTQVYGPSDPTILFPASANIVFTDTGGKFCALDANKRLTIAGAATTEIIGWAFTSGHTGQATAGDEYPVIISLDAVFLLPLQAARTKAQLRALVGEVCDLVVASNVQYADYTASARDVIQIVGWRYWGSASGYQGLEVRMNPNKMGATGVV